MTLTAIDVVGIVALRILPDSGAREHAGAAAMDLLGVAGDVLVAADGVRTELGRDAATTRAELVHVGGATLTGAVVAGATVACYRWVATGVAIADPAYAAVAVGSGLFAVVLVAWALRG
ncbi:hypothetical protein Htur_3329 [Haloterrigena turkmenica DSM 5511]|uniref:Uncharacterized protein n=1 Tax=Haloterrigena turkmenica (strain ATCC 51198 / DSM 5511 / JCM 9101 / NCIMB 13204 / VKM B-1734 / 4k) TaxID=543526 RepID=D2RPP1_HALTV|nr:hypothetical protein [Haloterrigena turkmenica]ADB62193.1 hypothetical protein Htur_3329 [Haloterrigena turkmenica DSM 5511]